MKLDDLRKVERAPRVFRCITCGVPVDHGPKCARCDPIHGEGQLGRRLVALLRERLGQPPVPP